MDYCSSSALFGAALAVLRIRQAEQKAAAYLRESLVAHARVLNYTSGFGRRRESLRLLREAAVLGGNESLRARVWDEVLAALALSDLEFSPQARLPANPRWVLRPSRRTEGFSPSLEISSRSGFLI